MPDIWGLASILTKLVLYVGITGSMGLVMIRAFYGDLVAPLQGQMQRQVIRVAGLALLAAVVSFMLRGAALTGGVDGMTDPEMLGLLWTTPVGDVLVSRVLGTVMIITGAVIPRGGVLISLAGGTLALWSFAQIGHIPEKGQLWSRILLLLHLLGVAFWIGILGPLRRLSLVPKHLDRAAVLGHRFGQAAMLIVPGLVLAGLAMAWMILGDVSALVTTGYGLTLLAKLMLVGGVLGLAAVHKHRFIPAMQGGDAVSAQRLARSLEIEAFVMLGILAATATLTSVLALPS